jgi:putative hydrolase of the HAD superfamily
MIRSVIFDIDDTLYSYKNADRAAAKALGSYIERQFGIPAQDALDEINAIMYENFDRMGPVAASHSRVIRFQNFLERHDLPLFPHTAKMTELYWSAMVGAAVPEKGITEFMQALRRRGCTIGIGSNMTAYIQYKKIEQIGLGPLIDYVVTSEDACVEKPEPGFFSFCLQKANEFEARHPHAGRTERRGAAGQKARFQERTMRPDQVPNPASGTEPAAAALSAEEILFIGDNIRFDVEGALAAGMHAAWYHPAEITEKERSGHADALSKCAVLTDFSSALQQPDILLLQ